MTRDDIIKMAREAGFNPVSYMGANLESFERFAALVAAAEREACAKVQEFVCSTGLCRLTLTQTNVGIGDTQAIRARSEL